MTTVDALPPDQRAVLQLVLQQGRSYDEIAGVLGIERSAVRQRALDALSALASGSGEAAPERGLVTDYLLGQLPQRVADQVLLYLESSPIDREWAAAVRVRLVSLAPGRLPAIPAGPPPEAETPSLTAAPVDDEELAPVAPAEPAADASPPASVQREDDRAQGPSHAEQEGAGERPVAPRPAPIPNAARTTTGTSATGRPESPQRRFPATLAVLAALVAAGVVLVVVLVASGGSSGPRNAVNVPTPTTVTAPSPTSSTIPPTKSTNPYTTTTVTPGKPRLLATLHLTSPRGATGTSAVAQVFRETGVLVIVIAADGLPPNTAHDAYAVWMYGPHSSSRFVGWVPNRVGQNGRLRTEGRLPADATSYRRILLTLETRAHPTVPGRVILSGRFRVRP